MDTEGVKVLFGNIMQPFKSAFGTEEKTDEKKEYTKGSLAAMYVVFILSFVLPLVYLAYLSIKMKIDVFGEMRKYSKDGYMYYALIAFSVLFGLVGIIATAVSTKVKDDSKGEVKK
jgi:uncharacterized BrkB/YihY/UPF0761 family membrane protein